MLLAYDDVERELDTLLGEVERLRAALAEYGCGIASAERLMTGPVLLDLRA